MSFCAAPQTGALQRQAGPKRCPAAAVQQLHPAPDHPLRHTALRPRWAACAKGLGQRCWGRCAPAAALDRAPTALPRRTRLTGQQPGLVQRPAAPSLICPAPGQAGCRVNCSSSQERGDISGAQGRHAGLGHCSWPTHLAPPARCRDDAATKSWRDVARRYCRANSASETASEPCQLPSCGLAQPVGSCCCGQKAGAHPS